jgi:hypothetical protein
VTTTKQFPDSYITPHYCTEILPPGGSPINVGPVFQTIKVVAGKTVGDNYPDWRQRIASHRDCTTSFFGVRYQYARKPFTATTRLSNGRVTVISGRGWGELTTPPYGTVSDRSQQSKATTDAMYRFTNKARSRLQSWQGGVFAGELRETAKLLASPTRRLFDESHNLLDQLLRLKKRSKRETAKALRGAIADTWLEWSFGVKPIVQDANDAAHAFNRVRFGVRADSLTIKATGSSRDVQFLPDEACTTYPGLPGPTFNQKATITRNCDVTIRAQYVLSNPSQNMPIATTFGLDLSSILPTAWELVPWSFLVDYFTDVGSAIDAWSIRLVEFTWTNTTVRNSVEHRKFAPYVVPLAGAYGNIYCPSAYLASGKTIWTERSKGLPAWEPYIPTLKIPGYPSTKWLNIAALLNGIVSLKKH